MTVRDIILVSDIMVTIWEYDTKSNSLHELATSGVWSDHGIELTSTDDELINKYGDRIVDSIDVYNDTHFDRIRIIILKEES